MGRKEIYNDKTKLRISTKGKTKLQPNSDRRAIVNLMVDRGGVMTLKGIDDHFGFEIRDKAIALVRAGWLEVVR